MAASDHDLTNLPRFLDHLGNQDRDPDAAAFARLLLQDGGEVETFWGPQQMDVWRLTIARRRRRVAFGVERGFPDWVGVSAEPAGEFIPLRLAVLGWARGAGVDFEFDDADSLHGGLFAHGTPALDWLDASNDDVLMRIHGAWRQYRQDRSRGWRRDPAQGGEVKAQGLRMIEEAAAPRAQR